MSWISTVLDLGFAVPIVLVYEEKKRLYRFSPTYLTSCFLLGTARIMHNFGH